MKTNKLYTLWIILFSLLLTANTAIKACWLALFKKIDRSWADQELQSWTHRILRGIKVHSEVINPHQVHLPKHRPTILMCNHSSLFDIPLSFLAFPKASVRMLAKKELTKIPFFGRAMAAAEFPAVNRQNRQEAIRDLKHVKELLASGIIMWVAPEGTRSKNGKLGPLKKGAFITAIETQATIIPIGIRGASNILPAKSFRLNLNQKAEIHIGQPIDASQYSLEQRDQLMHEVRDSLLVLLGETS